MVLKGRLVNPFDCLDAVKFRRLLAPKRNGVRGPARLRRKPGGRIVLTQRSRFSFFGLNHQPGGGIHEVFI